ncbi:hypothetical protein CNMCM5793_000928 [Aspergillus hiratsukae]|uniref:Uncharacterized protein n=1 Tax=Aspergillus hiratsukae TaxID=1194566 RepID=A0A8H6UDT9_9EURO|nr:hypothetical protein CNMCM5793_000928 [Aspergillus hiratsukae]KAF7163530.1 hypothetical protein CNMCM6106_000434 [Aspergillus hiratsukae]
MASLSSELLNRHHLVLWGGGGESGQRIHGSAQLEQVVIDRTQHMDEHTHIIERHVSIVDHHISHHSQQWGLALLRRLCVLTPSRAASSLATAWTNVHTARLSYGRWHRREKNVLLNRFDGTTKLLGWVVVREIRHIGAAVDCKGLQSAVAHKDGVGNKKGI